MTWPKRMAFCLPLPLMTLTLHLRARMRRSVSSKMLLSLAVGLARNALVSASVQ